MFNKSYLKKCKVLKMEPITQDKLVYLCKQLPKYQKKTNLQLLSHFRIRLQKMCCDSYLNTQSLNDLWLMFYIFEKDGKTWDEGKSQWLD